MPGFTSRNEIVDGLRALLERHEPELGHPLFREFGLAVLRTVDSRFLERRSGRETLTALEQSLHFIQRRQPDEILVRVLPGTPAILETNMRDQPFLYDTLRLLLDEEEIPVGEGYHAVAAIERAEGGEIAGVGGNGMPMESVIHLEIEGVESEDRAADLQTKVRERLGHARQAVVDYPRARAVVEEIRRRYESLALERPPLGPALNEARAFLGWLLGEHFIFTAVSYLAGPDAEPPDFGTVLGTFRDSGFTPDPVEQALAERPEAPYVRVRKSHSRSRIHRAGRLVHVLARWFDGQGRPGGLVLCEGLFTYRALGRPAAEVPMLAPLLKRLLRDAELPADAYRTRMLRYAFSVLPVEYLFLAPYGEIAATVDQILAAAESRSAAFHCTVDPAQRTAYAFVAIAKADYDDGLRGRIEDLLARRFGAPVVDRDVAMGVQGTAVMHFFVSAEEIEAPDQERLEEEVLDLVAPWRERLHAALERRLDSVRAERLIARYEEAFPEEYRRTTPAARTVVDIEHLESLLDGGAMAFDLFLEEGPDRPSEPQLRIYQREDVILSELMPILDHFGLLVTSQYETRIRLPSGERLYVDTFSIQGVRAMPGADVNAARTRFLDALDATFARRFTDSPLNALLLRTEMSWRDVGLLRAYLGYARQLGFRFPPSTVQETLLQHADLARMLTRIFRLKFNPRFEGGADNRARALESARAEFLAHLAEITDYAADRILRSLLNLMDATTRTNLFCRGETADNLAIKIDCARVELMTAPRPVFEIYVHHTSVQGVHLRGGKVARGGLRWSDRLDDFRTEILGLMATQMVKNSIIVPTGAKGGFVLPEPSADPAERRAQADAAYRVFIGALLDVTDNLVDGKTAPPEEVVCYDSPDPYLVVAADKGTAHLSDVANEIAHERDFWLGDAFASGGSQGYDHKVTGITARGAWVCAQRHLRELGIEPNQDPVSVAGIGDMSGDVFGNGLLCCRNFRLVAAFDHRHIFLDPDPDAEAGYTERERLFKLPRSSWDDYDRARISPGGGVFRRDAKEIRLSPQLKARFGRDEDALTGEEMIRAILTLDVDLLWNGGIGTYVKASTEDERSVGDRANDPVRVDAREVRAKVIGEGGNLGVTQAGRVEYSERGGRINVDAIDNSGGVDLSDHEVNLKILLEPMCRDGRLSPKARNRILNHAREEIVDAVLKNNESQSRLLSLDERRSQRDILRFSRAIRFLAKAVPFDPRGLGLPDARTMRARAQKGEGMRRPVLSLLVGYTKIYVKRRLLSASSFEDLGSGLEALVLSYFPRAVAEEYAEQIAGHLLGREIGLTVLTNRLVDDAGISFFPELEEWSGRSVHEIAAAYLSVADVADAWGVKEKASALVGRLPLETIYQARLRIEDGLEQATAHLLAGGSAIPVAPAQVRTVLERVGDLLPAAAGQVHRLQVQQLAATGLPEDQARQVAAFDHLSMVVAATQLAETTGHDPLELGRDFFAAAEASHVLEVERRMASLPAEGGWDAGALRTFRYRFMLHLSDLLRSGRSGLEEQVAVALSRGLGADLSVAALVTLEDRMRRIVAG